MKRFPLFFLLALNACSAPFPGQDTEASSERKNAEGWSNRDDPTLFSGDLEYNMDALPTDGEAFSIPWASSYWPTSEDSINFKWAGSESLSPAAKYGEAFGVIDVEDKVSANHGIDNYSSRTACTEETANEVCESNNNEKCAIRDGETEGFCIPRWWGICHAWAPLSIMEPEPVEPVTVNDVTFEVNDIKALLTLGWNRSNSKFVSLRCNESNSRDEIEYDEYNRPTGDDEECRDTNPGTYHVLLANYLGLAGQSFVEDRTFDAQVWNQPLRGYRITLQNEVTPSEAHQLLDVPGNEDIADTMEDAFDAAPAKGEWHHQPRYAVQADQIVTVEMTGENDGDLYVRFGNEPTSEEYDCRPWKGGSTESCEVRAPIGTESVYVSVYAYDDEVTTSVTVKIQGEGQDDTPSGTEYVFNDDADKLFHVKLEVDYISESNSTTNGNLADRIDRYTRTDKYQYILEVDSDGKIIGGEWVGSSKTNHPDFLWLPTGRQEWQSLAGGSIEYDKIKDLLTQSIGDAAVETGGNGESVERTETGHVDKNEWKHFGPFVAAEGNFTATMTGTGDADLYVRKGAPATGTNYDCRPYDNDSNEECSVEGPGSFYVGIHGYRSSDFNLDIRFVQGEEVVTVDEEEEAANEVEVNHLNESDSVGQGEMKIYELPLNQGRRIVARTEAPSDVDLYLRLGEAPTRDEYDGRGFSTSGNEQVEFTATEDGILYVGVYGYVGSDFTLTTADE